MAYALRVETLESQAEENRFTILRALTDRRTWAEYRLDPDSMKRIEAIPGRGVVPSTLGGIKMEIVGLPFHTVYIQTERSGLFEITIGSRVPRKMSLTLRAVGSISLRDLPNKVFQLIQSVLTPPKIDGMTSGS